MKKQLFYTFLIVSLALLTISILQLFYITPQDRLKYYRLIQTQKQGQVGKKEPIHQQRFNVQKDIWYLENGMRLHFSLFSTDSFLSLKEQKGKFELVEDLKNIHCFAQEKVFFNSHNHKWEQKLKYFNAKKGTYLFPSHQFISDMINLYFYDIEGAELPKDLTPFSPYLKGVASQVSFMLSDKKSHFKAYHFKASFDTAQEMP